MASQVAGRLLLRLEETTPQEKRIPGTDNRVPLSEVPGEYQVTQL